MTSPFVSPSLQVLELHPRPSGEAWKALAEVGCRLEEASTRQGRARLLRLWVSWSIFTAIHVELQADSSLSTEDMVARLHLTNPAAIIE